MGSFPECDSLGSALEQGCQCSAWPLGSGPCQAHLLPPRVQPALPCCLDRGAAHKVMGWGWTASFRMSHCPSSRHEHHLLILPIPVQQVLGYRAAQDGCGSWACDLSLLPEIPWDPIASCWVLIPTETPQREVGFVLTVSSYKDTSCWSTGKSRACLLL